MRLGANIVDCRILKYMKDSHKSARKKRVVQVELRGGSNSLTGKHFIKEIQMANKRIKNYSTLYYSWK